MSEALKEKIANQDKKTSETKSNSAAGNKAPTIPQELETILGAIN